MVLGIMILALEVLLANNAFAQFEQSLHDRRLSELINQTSTTQSSQIDVGDAPTAIGVSEEKNTLYVVKNGPDIVSVISGEDNTGIKDIEVGNSPSDIAVNDNTETAYVTNAESNSISVIDLENNTKIEPDISVGDTPTGIAVNEYTDTVYVANALNNSISVIDATTNEPLINLTTNQPLTIPVESPSGIAVNTFSNMYVVSELNNSIISVIDDEYNQPLINETTNQPLTIPVGGSLEGIAVNEYTDTVYVANALNNSISVIDGSTNEPLINETTNQPLTIPVGDEPVDIALYYDEDSFDDITNTVYEVVYVVNRLSDSVSVIDATTNEPLINLTTNQPLTIPVGDDPVDIAVNEITNTVYVANADSEGISVIDVETNELMTGVTFHVEPFNSGYIVCDELTTNDADDSTTPPSPVGQYTYVASGTQCMAKPYEGFEFVSWEQNLENNSTQLTNVSKPVSTWDSFLQFLHLKSSDKPEAKLMTKFGTFTANFREAPPPLPQEFWAQMYVVVGTVVTALFIPSIVGWFKSKRDVNKLNYYHKQIASLYDDGQLDEKDIGTLDRLRNRIGDAYSEGKLNEKHYESLRGEISTLYEEIFRKKIVASDKDNSGSVINKPKQEQVAQIKDEVELAFSKGKINEKHYDLLIKAISNVERKEQRDAS